MNRLEEILNFNKSFVENKKYEKYKNNKYPEKRMVIVSCMDTRLTELLPKALNLKNGDVKIIKNAGAIVTHPFGSVMRSILVAIYELKAEEVLVIGHHGCGMSNIDPVLTINEMIDCGISKETISTLEYSGINLNKWLHGFDCVQESIKESVSVIKNHPLIHKKIKVHGLIIDPNNGELEVVCDGNEKR